MWTMPQTRSDLSVSSPNPLESFVPRQGLLRPVSHAIQKIFSLDKLLNVYREESAAPCTFEEFFKRFLDRLGVVVRIKPEDLASVPRSGPVVFVANHPFGFVEGCILGAALPQVRPDIRLMANFLLDQFFPDISTQWVIPVDPFGGDESKRKNLAGMRRALAHLKEGHALAVFPAGEVAHIDWKQRAITDPSWSESIARIVRATGASVVPIYFDGANSAAFQVLGLLHPRLRTAMLPNELFNKQHREIVMRVGSTISRSRVETFETDRELIDYLRRRTYLLRHRNEPVKRRAGSEFPRSPFRQAQQEHLAAPVDPLAMEEEIARLPTDRALAEAGPMAVYCARQSEIPSVLREIGRLRELTFRASGEGTGKSLDLDAFDAHYLQLFIWDREQRQVIGAYRMAPTDKVRATHGKAGLYTHTLFHYDGRFLDRMGKALELGRSFVRAEHQKSYTPLLLLWKAIGAYVVQNPEYKVLFGAVSISNDYQPMSRELMVRYFEDQVRTDELRRMVRARSPFWITPSLLRSEDHQVDIHVWDVEDLSAAVADIEGGQKGIPVLLRQYLKLGGKLVGFNLDRRFSDALDGLIVADLTRTDARTLARYMGKEGAATFLAHHGISAGRALAAHSNP
jgi:putative hemolysin